MEPVLFTPLCFEGSELKAHMMISPIDRYPVNKLIAGSDDIAIVHDEISDKKWVIGRLASGDFVVLCDAEEEEKETLICDQCHTALGPVQ